MMIVIIIVMAIFLSSSTPSCVRRHRETDKNGARIEVEPLNIALDQVRIERWLSLQWVIILQLVLAFIDFHLNCCLISATQSFFAVTKSHFHLSSGDFFSHLLGDRKIICTHLWRGGVKVKDSEACPMIKANMDEMVVKGWGHMEEQTVNAFGKLVRLVGAHAKSLT